MCWISRKPRLATIAKYALSDAGLGKLALIVRAADGGRPELADAAAGLLAISKGLSLTFPDDHEMLQHGMVVHDALYAACSGTPLKNAAAWRV